VPLACGGDEGEARGGGLLFPTHAPLPNDPAAAVAAVLAEGGDVVCERNVRGAELGHLITDITPDHDGFGKFCTTHAVVNAMRSSEATTAQFLSQQVTDAGGFVPSTEALAVALRSSGLGRSSQLAKAKSILANIPSGKRAALLDVRPHRRACAPRLRRHRPCRLERHDRQLLRTPVHIQEARPLDS
jgi:hypothetical protein